MMGTNPPEFGVRGASASCPPWISSGFKHHIACITVQYNVVQAIHPSTPFQVKLFRGRSPKPFPQRRKCSPPVPKPHPSLPDQAVWTRQLLSPNNSSQIYIGGDYGCCCCCCCRGPVDAPQSNVHHRRRSPQSKVADGVARKSIRPEDAIAGVPRTTARPLSTLSSRRQR